MHHIRVLKPALVSRLTNERQEPYLAPGYFFALRLLEGFFAGFPAGFALAAGFDLDFAGFDSFAGFAATGFFAATGAGAFTGAFAGAGGAERVGVWTADAS